MQTATNMRHQLAFVPSLINVQDEKLLDKSVVGRTKIVTFRNTNGSYIPGQIQTLPRKYEEVTFKLQLATTGSPLSIGCWTIRENKVFHCTERERERERGWGGGSEGIWKNLAAIQAYCDQNYFVLYCWLSLFTSHDYQWSIINSRIISFL